jgi:hypothetical protein
VDEWTSLKMPTDINSLMEAMHVWIKRRGFMPHRSYACMESMRKLMAHLFVRKKTGGDLYLSAMRWSLVAVAVSYLHQRAVDPRDEDDDCDDELSFNLITAMGVLDYAECDRLFYCTEHPELQPRERRLCGRTWPAGTLEHATLPELRMTPLLNFERVSPVLCQTKPLIARICCTGTTLTTKILTSHWKLPTVAQLFSGISDCLNYQTRCLATT